MYMQALYMNIKYYYRWILIEMISYSTFFSHIFLFVFLFSTLLLVLVNLLRFFFCCLHPYTWIGLQSIIFFFFNIKFVVISSYFFTQTLHELLIKIFWLYWPSRIQITLWFNKICWMNSKKTNLIIHEILLASKKLFTSKKIFKSVVCKWFRFRMINLMWKWLSLPLFNNIHSLFSLK